MKLKYTKIPPNKFDRIFVLLIPPAAPTIRAPRFLAPNS